MARDIERNLRVPPRGDATGEPPRLEKFQVPRAQQSPPGTPHAACLDGAGPGGGAGEGADGHVLGLLRASAVILLSEAGVQLGAGGSALRQREVEEHPGPAAVEGG